MCKALYQKLIQKVSIDKVAHFAVSAFLVLALGRFIHWAISACVVLALGIVKELLDGSIDKRDLLSDAIGVCIGGILLII